MVEKVTVYSKPNCVQCNFTKKYMEDNNIAYEEINVMEDSDALDHIKSLGFMSMPVTFIGDNEPFSGFAPDLINKYTANKEV